MKSFFVLPLLLFLALNLLAQSDFQKIYDTEKAFEKAVAEKGANAAFIEFSAPVSLCFFSGAPEDCRTYWKNAPALPAFITWNPTFIDVSSNGALAYSTGNSVFRPAGKDDKTAFYGEYATVWQRQPNGVYLNVFDIGTSHEQPNNETKWTSPADSGKELNERKSSAADNTTAFYQTAKTKGLGKAYQNFLAEDARILREGKMPVIGKQNILAAYKKDKSLVNFAKRSSFVGAADLAYVGNSYEITDKKGVSIEKGNFLQVWKLRAGKWQIVLDVFLPGNTK